MTRDASEGVSSDMQPVDAANDDNCQADMRMDGMLTGDAKLPPKLARQAEQAERSQFALALADALRKSEQATEDNQ